MRIRLIILFFLFAASLRASASHLAIPPDSGCDVITLINGKLIYCKVKNIGLNKVQYSNCRGNSDSIKEIKRTSVFMVNYPGGKTRILTEITNDTLHKPKIKRKVKFVFAINGGISEPTGYYGSGKYYYTWDNPTYYDFATKGYSYNASIGILLNKGWEFSIIGMYIHNGFNAQGYVSEESPFFDVIGSYSGYIFNPVVTGNYSYNNYAIFGGLTKNVNISKNIFCRFKIAMGQFIFNIPSIKVKGDTNRNLIGSAINISFPAQNSGRNFGGDLAINLAIKVLPNISLSLNDDFIFASPPGYNNGWAKMFNYTLGIQYEF
jgi:hypothetical protein